MRRTMFHLALAFIWLPMASCSSGKKGEPDYQYLADLVADAPTLPEVPNHVFDLVTDLPPDTVKEVVVLPDGKIVEVAEEDVADLQIEPPDIQGDQGCLPQCTFEDGMVKECGPDGCGSICGFCEYGYSCVEGACKEYCEPQCMTPGGQKKQCGPDGCYGTCPPGCEADFACGEDGLCYPDCDHDAHCEGKQCGPDSCGGTCGSCGIGELCDEATGQCNPHPCGDIPEKGKCTQDNVLKQCVDNELIETSCPSLGDDYYCKWDGPSQAFVCAQGCVPNCTFPDDTPKECGYDGCYGVCGNCTEGWPCEAGACYPAAGAACGWVATSGTCMENQLWFCNGGKLYVDDCPANGMNCGFDTGTGKFKCK